MSAQPVTGPRPVPVGDSETPASQALLVQLDEFAGDALREESTRLGVSCEELAAFSVLYYLADIDSGRIARRLPRMPLTAVSALPAG